MHGLSVKVDSRMFWTSKLAVIIKLNCPKNKIMLFVNQCAQKIASYCIQRIELRGVPAHFTLYPGSAPLMFTVVLKQSARFMVEQ